MLDKEKVHKLICFSKIKTITIILVRKNLNNVIHRLTMAWLVILFLLF